MRRNFLFIFLWIFLFLSVQCEKSNVKCELGAFVENSDGTQAMLIDSGPVIAATELMSCEDSVDDCARMVEEQVFDGTNGGNLTLHVDERNGYSVGDVLCDKADAVEENIRNKIVHIYWRLCGSPWKPTSFKMPEPLCCEDGLYVPCRAFKFEL